MFDEFLRALKDRFFAPFARRLGGFMGPNTVSLFAFLAGMASAGVVLLGGFFPALLLWLVNRIADGLDGSVARETDRQTDFGGYLDIMLDFTVYAAVPVAFAVFHDSREVYLSAMVLLAVFYANAASWMYLSALAEKRGEKRRGFREQGQNRPEGGHSTSLPMPRGLIGGAETLVIYTLFFVFPGAVKLLFLGMAFLTLVTILQRLVWARRHLDR